jgi:hypothetical protein
MMSSFTRSGVWHSRTVLTWRGQRTELRLFSGLKDLISYLGTTAQWSRNNSKMEGKNVRYPLEVAESTDVHIDQAYPVI